MTERWLFNFCHESFCYNVASMKQFLILKIFTEILYWEPVPAFRWPPLYAQTRQLFRKPPVILKIDPKAANMCVLAEFTCIQGGRGRKSTNSKRKIN
jgi:hypothetical protein